MYKESLGIIGGFGAYATLNFYDRLLTVFASESEREYPHIIMDNNFTMPSRTRALLYNEEYSEIVEQIAKSMHLMIQAGCSRIVLVCGTAHYFLEDVFRLVPEAEKYVVDIIDVLGEELKRTRCEEVFIIAAEGALLKELYQKKLKKYGISCSSPPQYQYNKIRYFIESVKRNQINKEVVDRFSEFICGGERRDIVLGCTEFPVLIRYIMDMILNDEEQRMFWNSFRFWDPLEMTILKLKEIMI